MRTSKLMFTGILLLSLNAMAQDAEQASATTPATATPATSQAAGSPTSAATNQQPGAPQVPQGPASTMDQVVDRSILREHALMAFLKNRTPLVETYLQNLKPDAQLGAVPKEDHYFLGRLDLNDSVGIGSAPPTLVGQGVVGTHVR